MKEFFHALKRERKKEGGGTRKHGVRPRTSDNTGLQWGSGGWGGGGCRGLGARRPVWNSHTRDMRGLGQFGEPQPPSV